MADTKISAETAAAALDGTEITVGVQAGGMVKITTAQIKTLTSASPTLVTPTLGVAAGTSLALGGATIGTNALAVTGHLLVEGVASTGATGTGKLVFDGTPTLVTPVLGTPTSGTLTNCTIPVGGVTGMGTNVGTFLVTPSGANLAAALTSSLPATDGGTGQSTFAKGDILASPGSNTLNKLGVGTDAFVLTADAASTNGIKWAAAPSGAITINSTPLTGGTSTKLLFDNAGTVGELGPGTTTTLLHGNAAGDPSFGAVNLNADCSGYLPITVNAQTGTTYTMQTTDIAGLTTFSNGSAVAVTVPQATTTFATANFLVENKGVGAVTFTPITSTIDGAATLVLTTGQGVLIVSDGTNYTTMRGMSSATSSGNLTVGVSTIAGGATTKVLYDNAGSVGEYTISGSGNVAMTTSPSFTTPVLGTPTSGTLTNCTGLPAVGGGTGQATYAKGDILASPGSNTLNKLGVGTDGLVLTADAASTNGIKWAAAGGTGAPGGSDTQVQFNDGGSAFGGDAQLTWNKTTNVLTATASAHAGSTAPITILPDSGTSFTKIFDNGTMMIDADTGTGTNPLTIKYNGSQIFNVGFTGLVNIDGSSPQLSVASGVVVLDSVSMKLFEVTAPAGVANTARLFAVDNGSGKTVLKVIFGTGSAIQLAIEA